MNVETLKKVNALAKSLQEQGLAANMEDAMRLASGMVGNSEQHQFTTDAATQMQVKQEETNNSLEQNSSDSNYLSNESTLDSGDNDYDTPVSPINDTGSNVVNENISNRDVEDIKQKLLNLENRIEQNNTQSTNNFNFIQQIGNEIDKVYEKLNSLTKNLNELREKLSSNQQNLASENKQENNSFDNETKTEPDQTGSTTSGDLTPDNIDIRNYFYSGKK